MSFLAELRRRNVVRVGVAYAVASWIILQATDVIGEILDLPQWGGKLILLMLAVGFVLALFFAWAYELTPEGLKRESEVDRSQSIAPQTGRKLNNTILVLMALAIAYLLFDKFSGAKPGADPAPSASVAESAVPPVAAPAPTPLPEASAPDTRSIAVLPFVNMSDDAGNEYFSDGIAEELLNVLVRVNDLEVASRTSSFAYKGKDAPVSQIAAELGVDHVLEGSVRKAGNRVRITAQLIDARTDRHLWSETYERELDDIFDIQEEISGHIVDSLKIALNVEEADELSRLQRPTDNTEAYELYLQGRFKLAQRLEENIRGAIGLFERAIALDPAFARAHEALAIAHMVLPSWSDEPLREALPRATTHASRALELEPALAEARAVLAENLTFSLQWGEALDQYEAALEREPRNASLRQWYAESLADVGYLGQALEQIQRAYELDPASPVINNVYTYIASNAGEDERALRHMKIAMELGIDIARFNAMASLMRLGDWATIEAELFPRIPEDFRDIVMTCINARRDPSRLPQLEALLDQTAGLPPPLRAICNALVGRMGLAFDALRTELEEDPANIGRYWDMDPARQLIVADERFKDVLRDLNLVAVYEERGWPDRCRPDGAEDFRCDPE